MAMAEKHHPKRFLKVVNTLIVISSLSCTAQQKNTDGTKTNKMKTFDIQKFEREKDKAGVFSFMEKDTIVDQFKEDYYREYRKSAKRKNIKKLYTYDDGGYLIGEATYVLNLLTGKVITYNKEGVVIREDDYTRPNFKFTLEQLAEKMLKDYGIDMYNADNIKLEDSTRLDKEGKPIVEWWVIVETRENNTYNFKTYRISGTSGELISIEKGIFGGIN
jgi:hypothetical protein